MMQNGNITVVTRMSVLTSPPGIFKVDATHRAIPHGAIGGQPVEVPFWGLTRGAVGLYQLNVRVPRNSASGDVDLVVSAPPVVDPSKPLYSGPVPRDSPPVKISVQ